MESKPVRRPLRLRDYDYGADGVYFITICTKGRACTLGRIRPLPALRQADPVGADARIGPLPPPVCVELTEQGKIVERYLQAWNGIMLYTIMPNHIHFLLRIQGSPCGTMQASSPTKPPGKISVSQQVRMFKARVTRAAGQPVFQRSFYDRVVRNEEECTAIWQYIQYNPQRWNDDRFCQHPKGGMTHDRHC